MQIQHPGPSEKAKNLAKKVGDLLVRNKQILKHCEQISVSSKNRYSDLKAIVEGLKDGVLELKCEGQQLKKWLLESGLNSASSKGFFSEKLNYLLALLTSFREKLNFKITTEVAMKAAKLLKNSVRVSRQLFLLKCYQVIFNQNSAWRLSYISLPVEDRYLQSFYIQFTISIDIKEFGGLIEQQRQASASMSQGTENKHNNPDSSQQKGDQLLQAYLKDFENMRGNNNRKQRPQDEYKLWVEQPNKISQDIAQRHNLSDIYDFRDKIAKYLTTALTAELLQQEHRRVSTAFDEKFDFMSYLYQELSTAKLEIQKALTKGAFFYRLKENKKITLEAQDLTLDQLKNKANSLEQDHYIYCRKTLTGNSTAVFIQNHYQFDDDILDNMIEVNESDLRKMEEQAPKLWTDQNSKGASQALTIAYLIYTITSQPNNKNIGQFKKWLDQTQ